MSAMLSTAAWAAHDLGAAVGVGGSLFGRMAMEPSVRNIEDRNSRSRVVTDAWRRFGTVQLGALAIMAATWYAGRGRLSGRAVGGRGVHGLVVAKDILVGTTLASAVGAAVTGNLMAKRREAGEVPTDEEGRIADDAPPVVRRLGRTTDAFGLVNLVSGMALVAVTAVLAMQSGKSGRWSVISRLLP
jgi:uncharacterized membrane protein